MTQPIRKNVTLVVTQNCNLACTYCYEGYKSKQVMPLETALNIVESYLSNSTDEYDECVIEFFGGEPFLNFPLIKQVCEYVWAKTWKKPYLFFTTTNGTLVHGEIQDWLLKNKNRFEATLSLDGTQAMQDLNRSKSFTQIDIPFFRNTWPNASVKMTISKETLPHLTEGVIFLHALGFPIHNNLAYGIDWADPINIEILKRELEKLIEYYLSHPEIPPCSLMDMKIEYQDADEEKKWCGVGTHMVVFDVDSISYPCHAFLPMSIGKEKATSSRDLNFNLTQNLIDPKCKDCVLHYICPTCYGCNYDESGNVAIRDNSLCQLTKIRALACSYLKVKKLLANTNLDKLEGEDYLVAKSALKIQNLLTKI